MTKPKINKEEINKEVSEEIHRRTEDAKLLMQVCKTKEKLAYYAIVQEDELAKQEKLFKIVYNLLTEKQKAKFYKTLQP